MAVLLRFDYHRSEIERREDVMNIKVLIAGAFLAALGAPFAAQAQGIPGGAAHGYYEGGRIAGPVGAVVGTVVGGAIGGVEGVLGIEPRYYDRPYYSRPYRHPRKYSRRHRRY